MTDPRADSPPARPALAHLPADIAGLIRVMPKAELHLHLDGSVLPETALELARDRDVDAPRTLDGMRAALIAPERCRDQAELLAAFDLPIALLSDAEALHRVSRELVAAKTADGVRYVEIRWGPLLHVRGGLPLEEGIAAVIDGGLEGAAGASSASAGAPIVVRFICTALRSHDPADNRRLAEVAGSFRDRGLTGWDLAGPEAAYPDPLLHADAFDAARAAGLRITIHAGEWGGARQVRRALAVDPERIAHGSLAIDDADLVRTLADRRIALDLCPTSNVQAGTVPSVRQHPLARLHRAGVAVTLSTDDLTVSDIWLSEEYARAIGEIGLSPAELWAIDRRALDVAFADESDVAPLRAAFDAWAEGRPELAVS